MCNLHWCYTFCRGVTLFALVLHLNCTALSQSESSNFFMYIIKSGYSILVYTKTVDNVKRARWLARQTPNILCYYSTNCNSIQIWSWCSRYLSSVGNVYPAIYVASYVGRKSEVKKCRQKDLKMLRVLLWICWIIKQLSCSISRNIVWF